MSDNDFSSQDKAPYKQYGDQPSAVLPQNFETGSQPEKVADDSNAPPSDDRTFVGKFKDNTVNYFKAVHDAILPNEHQKGTDNIQNAGFDGDRNHPNADMDAHYNNNNKFDADDHRATDRQNNDFSNRQNFDGDRENAANQRGADEINPVDKDL